MSPVQIEGEHFLHRKLWRVVVRQLEHASTNPQGAFYDDLVAMVFALHTLEAYLNFAGERLAPEIWRKERDFFKNEPYRGFQGKLNKVMELAEFPAQDESIRPYSTIQDLKRLRDLIAHAKTEKINATILSDDEAMFHPTILGKLVSQGKAQIAKDDVEQFIELLHKHAKKKVDDVWFEGEALRGPMQYNTRSAL
jgi:hypothetical protein